ncbi:pectate lyase 1 isoform X2 [Selaginella moellendorffii]|nr:pectate lyase 1 isoform X1 [Selaginella moellendorffii]XP_024540688.1 pectate lyase 1 isoform X2 [Selaginella moellendorffii]|eukprot:XP_002980134.2 pectate lyase 1 isoform X1 [Selaginella moellendorffii]
MGLLLLLLVALIHANAGVCSKVRTLEEPSGSLQLHSSRKCTSDGASCAQVTRGRTLEEENRRPSRALLQAAASPTRCNSDGTTCQFQCGSGRALPSCAYGFAGGLTGGANGRSYVVTRPDDNPTDPQKGSLRYGVSLNPKSGGVWITFSKTMIIQLREMLWIRSDTTIDGRGSNITITGRSIVLAGVTNVILHNFQINSVPETDTVHVFAGSKRIWIDHLTSFSGSEGLVSVVQGSTDVTISNCYLSNRDFNMLLGASDSDRQDSVMRVTVFRNWFRDSTQRMPHCRFGYCHVVNNLYSNWGYYALGARVTATILSEFNVFVAGSKKEVTPWFAGANSGNLDMTAVIQSKNDSLRNGSTFHQFLQRQSRADDPPYRKSAFYPPRRPTRDLAGYVQRCAGALFGSRLRRCIAKS